MDNIILVGAGGHCKVIIDAINSKYDVVGIIDADLEKKGTKFYGNTIIGTDEELRYIYMKGTCNAFVAVGSVGRSNAREKLYYLLKEIGFYLPNILSTNTIISKSVKFGEGNIVMDGAIIHSDTVMGFNNIINTGAIIEHDCVLGSHVHVAPGARIAGGVKIGNGSHIGIGSTIIQNISVGANSVVGAGAVVINDVPDNTLVVGVPAKEIKSSNYKF